MKLIFMVFFVTAVTNSVSAQGKMTDQYRQMGGIAALAEMCLNQKRLENQLFKSVGITVANNPKMGRMLFQLMALYFESYEVAKKKELYGVDPHRITTINNLTVNQNQILL